MPAASSGVARRIEGFMVAVLQKRKGSLLTVRNDAPDAARFGYFLAALAL
jgi:hypothetical protein